MAASESSRQEKTLLAISIPTYKRLEVFKRLLSQLSKEICALSQDQQRLLVITVYDNPSDCSSLKESSLREMSFGATPINWINNTHNIGGEANVEQCCITARNSTYTWVIGDDEQLVSGSMQTIIDYLKANSDCGLLVLRDSNYQLNAELVQTERWNNSYEFVKEISIKQPHLILAHTLISCNIFRSSIFDANLSCRERTVCAPRAGLPSSFNHMIGILSGLSTRDDLAVYVLPNPAIDTSSRAPSEEIVQFDDAAKMSLLYRHYLYWIGHQFGIDIATLMPLTVNKTIVGLTSRLKRIASIAKKSVTARLSPT